VTREQCAQWLQDVNVRAFLRMIRVGEGTSDDDGYRRHFGGELFDDFADHPRRAVTRSLGGRPITSTAAGAYQFLARTWDECAAALGLADFSPQSQDLAAVFLVARRRAIDDVLAGRIEAAIAKCAREWASLPGSPYGQPTKTLEQALDLYAGYGGQPSPAAETTTTAAEAPPKEPTMLAPFIAAALPALIEAAPGLIRIFGDSPQAEKNAKAADLVVAIAKKATGETTAEGAVKAIQTDPAKAAAYREAVHVSMGELLATLQAVNDMDQRNLAAARAYNAEEPLFVDTPWVKFRFVHVLSLLFVGFSGWFVLEHWVSLTSELRGAVITLMVIAGWNGVRDYWMGSSDGSARKTAMLTEQAKR